MRYFALALLLFGAFALYGCTQPVTDGNVACTKDGTDFKVTDAEAMKIASESICLESGTLTDVKMCNSGSGTYWINMDVQGHEGCSPACVVNLETKTAEINWRCTGLITPTPTIKGSPTENPEASTSPAEIKMADANNKFSFDFYSQVKGKDGNQLFSSFSMEEAFGMLYEGATGNTATELQKVFGFEADAAARKQGFSNLNAKLNSRKENYTLTVANALFAKKEYPILDSYKETLSTYYGSEISNLDYGDAKGTADFINNWCSEKTAGKIDSVIEPKDISPDLALILANAVYFKGKWENEFDKTLTKNEDFTTSGGQKVSAPMMHSYELKFPYMENSDLQMLELPYRGGDLSMVVLLPKNNDIARLESKLTKSNFNSWTRQLANQEVYLYLPKFKFRTEYDLKPELQKMGVKDVFQFGPSDLSGIDGTRKLYVGFAKQLAYIDVNEEGTEAAAVTVIGIKVGAAPNPHVPPTFKADHPFIFLIQEKATGSILFMGRVSNPLLTE